MQLSLEKATVFLNRKWNYKWSYWSPGCLVPQSTPRAEPGWETWPRTTTGWPAMAVAIGQLCAWATGPAGEAGTAGSVPRPGQKPPVLSLTGFSFWSQPWAGAAEPQTSWPRTGQWFGPHNQQDPLFGAACCLLPPLQGCSGEDQERGSLPAWPQSALCPFGTPGASLFPLVL